MNKYILKLPVLDLAAAAARAAATKTDEEIVVMDMREVSAFTDVFVVVGARNTRQVKAIVDEVERSVKDDSNIRPIRIEGMDDCTWVLMDYGDMIIHIFNGDAREFYDLEGLWGDAPRVCGGAGGGSGASGV